MTGGSGGAACESLGKAAARRNAASSPALARESRPKYFARERFPFLVRWSREVLLRGIGHFKDRPM